MRYSFTPEQEKFRRDIRDFLKEELPRHQDLDDARLDEGRVSKEFSGKLAGKGWIGLAWPVEHGGRGLGHIERFIYNEEMVYHQAPLGYHRSAERQMGPSIILNGSGYQKKTYLPRIASAEIGICIGYSEPNSGSDLAGLQTAAVPDGDDYVINGEKIFTSGAHVNEYVWLAARTNADAPKHKGVSVFLVPLDTPGVTVQPLWSMAGTRFNQVYFNDVRVHSRELVGEKDQGWYVVAANLDFERSGIERVTNGQFLFEEVVELAKETRANGRSLYDRPAIKNLLADISVGYAVGRLLAFRVAYLQSQGTVPNQESSMAKVYGTELSQQASQAMMQVLGLYGPLWKPQKWARLAGRVASFHLVEVSTTIRGGTSEIQRNVMATRGLGLPR